jgi:peptidoglycan hydrolase-like protein with peptidoglycan-binding domain
VLEAYEFRRSLRASRKRRAAALRKRRAVRSYRSTVGVLAGFAVMASLAAAANNGHSAVPEGGPVKAAQAALGVSADGIVGPVTRRAVRNFQRNHGLVVDGVIGPQTLAALGLKNASSPRAATSATAARTGAPTQLLAAIARCESGGDPTAISGGGQYRGKYQFTRETWRSVGGSGDPAQASEAEQDRRAQILMRTAGPSQWPACSAQAGA